MELHELRYSELQRLAKQHGLRANLKAEKLLKNLQEFFQEQKDGPALKAAIEENTCNTVNVEKWEDSNVTKRRGKERLPNDNQNESLHSQIFTASENEQPSMEPSPRLEKCQSTEGSDLKRRQKKRHVEFEDSIEKDEITGNAADESAPVIQCSLHVSNEKVTDTSKGTGTATQSKTGKIPCLIRATGKPGLKSPAVGKTALNHVTPDWKKIHQARFNKMESIDLYIERKRKRFEKFGNSIKQSVNEPKNMKNIPNFFSPVHQTSKNDQFSTPANQRKSPRNSAAVTLNEKSAFKPSVYSVTKMNVRFPDAAKNTDKHGTMKTPIRKLNPGSEVKNVRPSGPEEPICQKQTHINACNPAETKVVTPYRFSGTTTPGTNKKFDLQASLARPLRYKPHKGKLKSWEEMKENACSLKKDPKQPKLQTRETRREKFLEERKERKNNVIGARRGLVMAK